MNLGAYIKDMMRAGKICVAASLVFAGFYLDAASTTVRIAMPPMREVPRNEPFELRVLYLEDSRLPTIDAARRAELFGKVEDLLHDWYGYSIRLREVARYDLSDYFAAHESIFEKHSYLIRMDVNTASADDRSRLQATIKRALAPHSLPLIATHFPGKQFTSKEEAERIAYDHFLERLREIQSIALPGGGTFVDPARSRLNSYVHWLLLAHEMKNADIMLTNSMIVGADVQMPIYVIGRGGITTGNTNQNLYNRFQAANIVGLFPFLSDAPFWMRERGLIPDAERLDVIASFMMHELGHFLLRQAEHYDHPHCVHVAPVGLRYFDWHLDIRKNGPCRLEHRRLTQY